MSTLLPTDPHAAEAATPSGQPAPCPSLELLLAPRTANLGEGFTVRRLLPRRERRLVGPWIFLDHFGPVTFAPGRGGMDVPPHPHIGLATVTYLFEGGGLHRDSLGTLQRVEPGAINLMAAGKGIAHSERTPDDLAQAGFTSHGLQLWLALPESHETMDPAFYHTPAEAIPRFGVDDAEVRLLMGAAYGHQSPVPCFSPTLYLEARLPTGGRLTLPPLVAQERAVYVVQGALETEGQAIEEHHLGVLTTGKPVELTATAPTTLVVVGGDPVGDRYIDWNFVATTRERIEAAKTAWQARNWPLVPGDEEEWVPLPKQPKG